MDRLTPPLKNAKYKMSQISPEKNNFITKFFLFINNNRKVALVWESCFIPIWYLLWTLILAFWDPVMVSRTSSVSFDGTFLTFLDYFENNFENFLDLFGAILGTIWKYFGTLLGHFLGLYKSLLPYWDHFRVCPFSTLYTYFDFLGLHFQC